MVITKASSGAVLGLDFSDCIGPTYPISPLQFPYLRSFPPLHFSCKRFFLVLFTGTTLLFLSLVLHQVPSYQQCRLKPLASRLSCSATSSLASSCSSLASTPSGRLIEALIPSEVGVHLRAARLFPASLAKTCIEIAIQLQRHSTDAPDQV